MPEENEDEIAVAMAMAIAERLRESNPRKAAKPNAWHRGADPKMPLSWSRASGWKNISRHESARGRKGW